MYIRVLGSLLNAIHGEALQCTQTVALYYINHITKTRTTFLINTTSLIRVMTSDVTLPCKPRLVRDVYIFSIHGGPNIAEVVE